MFCLEDANKKILAPVATYRCLMMICMISVCGFATRLYADTSLRASVDSTTLVMGDRTVVRLEIITNDTTGQLIDGPVADKPYHGVDIIECLHNSEPVSNDVYQMNYEFLVQAFDPGVITLPPFKYLAGRDTAKSDIVTLKVLPVELSPELGDPNNVDSLTIHPSESIVPPNTKWYDYVPSWWYWVVIAIALISLVVILIILYKKNGPSILPKRVPPIPPYELAMMRLNRLREQRLPERGQDKEYYTEITDILRRYLEGRFGINALEMSSTQIMQTLLANEETRLSASQMQEVLRIADFVKFAKVRPLPDDNIKSFNSAMKFVEDTKPAPVEVDEKGRPIKQEPNKSTTVTQ